jgi:hypothetical protein
MAKRYNYLPFSVFVDLRYNNFDITITQYSCDVFRRDRAVLGRLSKIISAVACGGK